MNVFIGLLITAGLSIVGMAHNAHALSSDAKTQLQSAKEIYVATQRKNGEWSTAAPIWFMYADDVVYFTVGPTSYKARRIKSGRNAVRIWVGSKDGPMFSGKAGIFTDSTMVERMGEAYKKKYWLAWFGFARPRASRVESGKTVAIKVIPDAAE